MIQITFRSLIIFREIQKVYSKFVENGVTNKNILSLFLCTNVNYDFYFSRREYVGDQRILTTLGVLLGMDMIVNPSGDAMDVDPDDSVNSAPKQPPKQEKKTETDKNTEHLSETELKVLIRFV